MYIHNHLWLAVVPPPTSLQKLFPRKILCFFCPSYHMDSPPPHLNISVFQQREVNLTKNRKTFLFSTHFSFLLKYSYFTVLCQFQVYSKVIHLYICVFRLFSIIGYCKILSIVPCATQQVLVACLFYVQQYVYVNIYHTPNLSFLPSFSFLVTMSLFS